MSEKTTVCVLSSELNNGYIFKNFFMFNDVKGRPVISCLADYILASNRTAEDELYVKSHLRGDEIKLTWNRSIPLKDRQLSLTFDSLEVQSIISKIKKKDEARIFIYQVRNINDPHNFSGPGSCDEFIIWFSSGTGGDGREGLKHVNAIRVEPDNTAIRYPNPQLASTLIIPVKLFKQMIDSFTKCKKERLKIRYYLPTDQSPNPAMDIITEIGGQRGPIYEKYGQIPEEQESFNPGFRLDSGSVVKTNETTTQFIIESPNEYSFPADKISSFSRLATMHTEGSVRIIYQKNCHLWIAHRFGAFGECEICLFNNFTSEQ